MFRKIVFTFSFVLLSVSAWGQTTNGSISGTVADSTNAVLPGVKITAMNARTGVSSDTLTNESGAYQFPGLQTGAYKLSAELPGFQTVVMDNVLLEVSSQLRMNFTMKVASVSQDVDVVATADTALA